jgi:hypothetical protein
LAITLFGAEILREFPATVMILKDREGEGRGYQREPRFKCIDPFDFAQGRLFVAISFASEEHLLHRMTVENKRTP